MLAYDSLEALERDAERSRRDEEELQHQIAVVARANRRHARGEWLRDLPFAFKPRDDALRALPAQRIRRAR